MKTERAISPINGNRVTLARALSKLGFMSRSKAPECIKAGRVCVNGVLRTNPEVWIDLRSSTITVDGTAIQKESHRTIAFHKPANCVTTRSDERHRTTVFDILGDTAKGLITVGRLDKDTTGLLLLTSDHRLADVLTDPQSHVTKRYRIVLKRPLTHEELERLRVGIEIQVKGKIHRTREANVASVGDRTYELVITEGKNRQVRRMLEAIGHQVESLHRAAMGPIDLGSLSPGEWRELSPQEAASLQELVAATRTKKTPIHHGKR